MKKRHKIPIRLPDGYKLAISNRAKEEAKITGKRPNMSKVVRDIIEKFIDKI